MCFNTAVLHWFHLFFQARARGIIPPDERPVKYNPTPISVTQALHAVGAPVQKQEEKSVNEVRPFINLHYKFSSNKSNLYYGRGITPKRAASSGAHLRGLAPRQHSSKKHRSDGEPLATVISIWPARDSNPRPTAPTAMDVTTELTRPFRIKVD